MQVFLLALLLSSFAQGQVVKIGVGSCAHQDSTQSVWKAVQAWNPDLFVHLGDAVYADARDSISMRRVYEKGFSNSLFQEVRTSVPFFATWDDHDYGDNDAGASYPLRDVSKAIFL
jgi:alkaline phosphatase D